MLAILDGWGVASAGLGNAITQAALPNMARFIREYPVMTLSASGNEVGLSFGEMGNSEVGHLNIGAGRVYYQSLPRIDNSIASGSFFSIDAFLQAMRQVKEKKSALHLIGLVSAGNVHASQEHCYALLRLARDQKLKNVYIHVILDGRDTTKNSGIDFVRQLMEKCVEYKVGKIASLSGRYYALDRDNRWDRIAQAYHAMAEGISAAYATDPVAAITASYNQGVYDEEFIPLVVGREGKPTAAIQAGDGIIFFNFRPDRARELTEAFVLPGFAKFDREYIRDITFVTMTEYEKEIPVLVAFPPMAVHDCLAEILSNAGLTQLHIAETEKYAHITFFLNGTIEDPFPGEERIIIPSPAVSSYDQAPEMSAAEITKAVVKDIDEGKHDVIFINYANADMVGHTGDLAATIRGCAVVDKGLDAIADHALAQDGVLIITADHGNAEEMINLQTHEKDKEHSTNPVPFLLIGNAYKGQAGPAGDPPAGDLSLMPPVGVLADVAPTVLKILGINQPEEMTGRSLI